MQFDVDTTFVRTARILPEDKTLVFRVVGFFEYQNALANFDPLLQHASREELEAIEGLVAQRREYTVYTNLARRLQRRESSLAETAAKLNEGFNRHGFTWVVALARIELAAMLTTFGQNPSPFEIVSPTRYERPAFSELLLDGAQTHFWALANDNNVARVAQAVPSRETLAYGRRLKLALFFLDALIRERSGQLSSTQVTDARQQVKTLFNLARELEENIQKYLTSVAVTQRSSETKRFRACIIRGARFEETAGLTKTPSQSSEQTGQKQ